MEGDWGDCELLIVDLPPGTGDVQMTLIQKWKPAGAVIVSTPQDLALIDATRAIDMFRKMDVPVIGLVENMAGYACPHCGEVSDPFGSGGAEAAAGVMGIPFLGRIPLEIVDPPGLRRRHAARRRRGRGGGDLPRRWPLSCSQQVERRPPHAARPVTRTSTPCSPRRARSR